jgi:hypothetical protein
MGGLYGAWAWKRRKVEVEGLSERDRSSWVEDGTNPKCVKRVIVSFLEAGLVAGKGVSPMLASPIFHPSLSSLYIVMYHASAILLPHPRPLPRTSLCLPSVSLW